MPAIALVTYRHYPALTTSDARLAGALAARGCAARPAAWDDPGVDWTAFEAIILRSCWDYHTRPDEFRAWLARLETVNARLWNPPDLVRWNMDKTYLRDLAARGASVVPTSWLAAGQPADLPALLRANGWPQAVIKPQISASAHDTWYVALDDAADHQPTLDRMLTAGGVLIQPYLPQIQAGEYSVVFFDGVYSHTILKRPGSGSIFVQAEQGGTWQIVAPDPALIAQARAMLAAAPGDGLPLYARVDAVQVDGHLVLMELELIEPGLFLDARAAAQFAEAVIARLS